MVGSFLAGVHSCEWIGNTPAVANKQYLQITDEDYAQALEAWRVLNRHAG